MPYNPGISYHGDQYIFQGLQNAGQTLGDDTLKALQRYQDIQKQKAFGDQVMEHAANTPGPNGQPYVPIDALNKYHAAGLSAQAGMVQATQANIAADMQKAQLDRQNKLAEAQAAYYAAHGNYMNARATAEGADDNSPIQVDPLTDPSTGKPTPGMGIVRKTGAVVNTAADSGQVQLDPSGKFFFDNKARTWKPLPAVQMIPGFSANGAAGAQGAPTFPQSAPGQPQLPANPGMTPGAPGLMPPQAGAPGGNPILDQARQAIQQGAPRAAVLARLQQLGVDASGL